MPPVVDPNVLVGTNTSDDAGVYRLSDTQALIATVDFFTPIVDDARAFGAIAAANSLSDVYAMGGRPLFALNLVGFPRDGLPMSILADILAGGGDKVQEAGISIIGGHSIDDPEPKYGLAVTGLVDPSALVRNSTARAGDELWLTKPIGGGAATTALKRGSAPAGLEQRVVEVMAALNAEAAAAAVAAGASAMTDVTGFGLLGHLHEMATASGVAAEIQASAVPVIDGVEELLHGAEPPVAGGTRRNREWLGDAIAWDDPVAEERRWLLSDAMTSGGLLVALPAGVGGPGVRIGRVAEGEPGRISVSA